jgi:glycerol-3-phosphate acyltransferase PlsY
MPTGLAIALALAASYVVGSIDFAVIVARMHGVDIRAEGSGNPGASNVLRTIGKFPAAMVFVLDMLKGFIGSAMVTVAAADTGSGITHWAFAGGLAAVVGHCYPLFHRLKGGKGVATGAGVLLWGSPIVGLIDIATWFLVVALTKTASIGSLVILVITIPLLIWRGVTGLSLVWIGLILVLVLWRHRQNITRMARGSEEKVSA